MTASEHRPEITAASIIINALFDLDEETRSRVLDLVEEFFRPMQPKRGRPQGVKNKPKTEGVGV